ncbi:MAG: poly-beta-hydroxybutyrate polymerase N-terminal domain-containing protein, partial [Terriglobia bacterium]
MNETPTRVGTPQPVGDKFVATTASPVPRADKNWSAPSFDTMDRLSRAVTARFTQGISPYALYAAWFDWASHLSHAPGRLLE